MRNNNSDMAYAKLHEYFNYDSQTGLFTWAKKAANRVKLGAIATYVKKSTGYCYLTLFEAEIPAHRAAWVHHYGVIPNSGIDHIDRDKTNNKICNLRLAGQLENTQNSSIRIDNTSGFKGVCFNKERGLWVANVNSKGIRHYLGAFSDPKDASLAREEFAKKLHGEFYADTTVIKNRSEAR